MGQSTGDDAARHLDSLDGMRAVAIGAVFLLHAGRAYFPGGAFGVDVFFVLSSYLITSILLNEVRRNDRIGYRAFYWRRVFRLAPALVAWLVVIAVPTAILGHEAGTIPWSTAGALFYFNDFLEAWTNHVGAAYDQSWSLAVEEQFYLVWPFILALIATRLTPPAQRRSVVVLVAASVAIWLTFGNYFLPTGHLVPLALGCWAAFWLSRGGERRRLGSLLRSVWIPVACLTVFVAALVYAPLGEKGDLLALLVSLAATALMLHCILNAESVATRLLASPIMRWIGVRSYGIYLYGLTLLILIPLVTHLSLHWAAPIDVVATGVVVAISYRYLETPVRTRGRQWLASSRQAPSTGPEPGPAPGPALTHHQEVP